MLQLNAANRAPGQLPEIGEFQPRTKFEDTGKGEREKRHHRHEAQVQKQGENIPAGRPHTLQNMLKPPAQPHDENGQQQRTQQDEGVDDASGPAQEIPGPVGLLVYVLQSPDQGGKALSGGPGGGQQRHGHHRKAAAVNVLENGSQQFRHGLRDQGPQGIQRVSWEMEV